MGTVIIGGTIGLISLLISLTIIPKSLKEYHEINTLYKTKKYKTIEGEIERFDPMPYEGHKNESFYVNGKYFYYSDYLASHGFSKTSSHKGPIKKNGQYVKLGYIKKGKRNVILKIELRP